MTWDQLGRTYGQQRPAAGLSCFIVSSDREAFSRCGAMASMRQNAILLPSGRMTPSLAHLLRESGASLVDGNEPHDNVVRPGEGGPDTEGYVSILTSGTTGAPKLVRHTWTTLFTAKRARDLRAHTWLLPYQVGTYAWYQVVTLGLFAPGHRLVPVDASDIHAVIEHALASRADAISSTPTFWRVALLGASEAALRSMRLDQITLGGEIVDAAILSRLHALYPHAAITHIYASTEAGASIVVRDGRAGFPATWLAKPDVPVDGIALRIEEGHLFVRSPFSSRASEHRPGDWVDTGDRVQVREDRVLFLGRSEAQLINVGGNKAYPADIEAVLLTHPRVAWCRVSARKAAIVGFLPVAEVLLSDADQVSAETALFAYCRGRLPEYAVPRMWTFVDRIPVTGALKTQLCG